MGLLFMAKSYRKNTGDSTYKRRLSLKERDYQSPDRLRAKELGRELCPQNLNKFSFSADFNELVI